MNTGAAFLLVLGTALFLGTFAVAMNARKSGAWLFYLGLYVLAAAFILAGFGLYTIPGVNG